MALQQPSRFVLVAAVQVQPLVCYWLKTFLRYAAAASCATFRQSPWTLVDDLKDLTLLVVLDSFVWISPPVEDKRLLFRTFFRLLPCACP